MMVEKEDKIRLHAMYRRWAYMAVAILATVLTSVAPLFSFYEDKGIRFVRSHSMDLKVFSVTQTVLDEVDEDTKAKMPTQQVTKTISVYWLYVFQRIMFWACILCVFLFYPTNIRLYISAAILALGGIFYALLIHYAIKISSEAFATLTPTWVAFMPAVMMAMMILLHRNVMNYGNYFDDLPET